VRIASAIKERFADVHRCCDFEQLFSSGVCVGMGLREGKDDFAAVDVGFGERGF
jgi:hypothetical protein